MYCRLLKLSRKLVKRNSMSGTILVVGAMTSIQPKNKRI